MYGNNPYDPSGAAAPSVPFEQPKSLFRFGETSIWSSFAFAGAGALASSQNRLFSTPQGQTGQGYGAALSIAETNQREGGRVPSGVAYDVYGIACQVMQGNQAAVAGATFGQPADTANEIAAAQNIINNGVLSWDFTQTIVEIAPVALVGQGGGLFGAVAQNAAGANSGAMNNGNGQVWMYRKYPVALPGNTTFSIILSFGSRAAAVGTNCISVRCTLLGYYKNIIEIG